MNFWFLKVLQIIFITLKVLDTVTLNWWQVFIPAYVFVGVVIFVSLLSVLNKKSKEIL